MVTAIRETNTGPEFSKHPGGTSKTVQVVSAVLGPDNANVRDMPAFQSDGRYRLARVSEIHTVAGTDGGAVTLDIQRRSGATSPFATSSMLSSTFDLKGAANTVVTKTDGSGLNTTEQNLILNEDDRLILEVTGTLTSLVGVCVTLVLVPLITQRYKLSPTQ